MPDKKPAPRAKKTPKKPEESQARVFEVETGSAAALRLVPAQPAAKEAAAGQADGGKKTKQSSDLIHNLIECIKSI
jgi:hypothetical protein